LEHLAGGQIVAAETAGPMAPADLLASAKNYASASKAARTRAAYRADLAAFASWCVTHGLDALPALPASVALYVTFLADDRGRKVSTIGRALVAISQAHKAAGMPSPTSSAEVREVMKGIRRTRGVAQTQKAPVLVADLLAMIRALPEDLRGARDRALLLAGFAGAFRRSELVSLDVADVVFMVDGLEITLRRSKTDQEGQGRKIGVPYGSNPDTCPVRSLKRWLDASGVVEGPLFREVRGRAHVSAARLTDAMVARIVKRTAKAAGLDPARFAGHSLRAGLATSAAKAGKSERAIMAQTGHRSVAMVRRYIRDANLFTENAAAGIGL